MSSVYDPMYEVRKELRKVLRRNQSWSLASTPQEVGAATSPSPATNVVSEDEGQRNEVRQEGVKPAVSDKFPAGQQVYPPQPLPQQSGGNTDPGSRSHRITVRLSGAEAEAIRRRSKALGVAPSSWVRAAALYALDAANPLPESVPVAAAPGSPDVARAVEQLRRVGVNLNQALRRGSVVDAARVRDLARAVDELRSQLGDRTVIGP